MGILTRRDYLADGISYLESIRLLGIKHGLYSIFVEVTKLPEADQKKITALGVEGKENARYVRIHGYKPFFGNDTYSVDFFDKDMKQFASANRKGMSVVIKYYTQNLYSDEPVSKLVKMEIKRNGSRVFVVTMFTNYCSLGYSRIVKLIKRLKTLFPVQNDPDDHDIIGIERQMHYDVGVPENSRKYDVVTIKYGNNFMQELWINSDNDKILLVKNMSPDREKNIIWIMSKESGLKYAHCPPDRIIDLFSDDVYCTIEEGVHTSRLNIEDRSYEFDTKDMHILYDELESGEFPEHFVADVIDDGKDVSI